MGFAQSIEPQREDIASDADTGHWPSTGPDYRKIRPITSSPRLRKRANRRRARLIRSGCSALCLRLTSLMERRLATTCCSLGARRISTLGEIECWTR